MIHRRTRTRLLAFNVIFKSNLHCLYNISALIETGFFQPKAVVAVAVCTLAAIFILIFEMSQLRGSVQFYASFPVLYSKATV